MLLCTFQLGEFPTNSTMKQSTPSQAMTPGSTSGTPQCSGDTESQLHQSFQISLHFSRGAEEAIASGLLTRSVRTEIIQSMFFDDGTRHHNQYSITQFVRNL